MDKGSLYFTSDRAIENTIGLFIKQIRLQQNLSQIELASKAGLHRNTIYQIESGEGGTISSLIQLLRALDHLHLIKPLEPALTMVSPIQLAKLQSKSRKRAGRPRKQMKTYKHSKRAIKK
jgi:transcriptional regulator with XRE-family HTH domain